MLEVEDDRREQGEAAGSKTFRSLLEELLSPLDSPCAWHAPQCHSPTLPQSHRAF